MDEPRRIPVVDRRRAAQEGSPVAGEPGAEGSGAELLDVEQSGADQASAQSEVTENATDATGVEEQSDFLDDLRRLQADFDNYRKRMMREQAATAERAKGRLIEQLLPVLDAFDQASVHEDTSGIELIGKQLRITLEAEGLEEIPAEGVPFDPHVHEAVDSREDPDVDHIVTRSVYRRGYKLGDRVLRPAMVVVARPAEPQRAEEESSQVAEG
jgi:molecular chaperone GrpE